MAKQRSFMNLEGNMGDVNFFKGSDGYGSRYKGGVDADRIANDPQFERTRENNAEFSKAAKATKQMRNALQILISSCKDKTISNRLFANMMRAIKADTTSIRGQRNIIDGEAELLTDFEFNSASALKDRLLVPYTGTIDRVTGSLSVSIPSFIPRQQVVAPVTATHFKIVSAGTEIDFENRTDVTKMQESAMLPWDINSTAVIELVNNVTANSAHPLFLVLGIQFYQEVNGNMYPLKNGAFNSLAIIKVLGL